MSRVAALLNALGTSQHADLAQLLEGWIVDDRVIQFYGDLSDNPAQHIEAPGKRAAYLGLRSGDIILALGTATTYAELAAEVAAEVASDLSTEDDGEDCAGDWARSSCKDIFNVGLERSVGPLEPTSRATRMARDFPGDPDDGGEGFGAAAVGLGAGDLGTGAEPAAAAVAAGDGAGDGDGADDGDMEAVADGEVEDDGSGEDNKPVAVVAGDAS